MQISVIDEKRIVENQFIKRFFGLKPQQRCHFHQSYGIHIHPSD